MGRANQGKSKPYGGNPPPNAALTLKGFPAHWQTTTSVAARPKEMPEPGRDSPRIRYTLSLRTRRRQWTNPSITLPPRSSMAASTAGSRRGFLETLAARLKLRGARSTSAFCSIWRRTGSSMGARWSSGFGGKAPAGYLKVCAMLLPREMKLEHSGGVKAMTDEELEQSIEILKALIAERDAGVNAKVIEGEAEVVPSLPAPAARKPAS